MGHCEQNPGLVGIGGLLRQTVQHTINPDFPEPIGYEEEQEEPEWYGLG